MGLPLVFLGSNFHPDSSFPLNLPRPGIPFHKVDCNKVEVAIPLDQGVSHFLMEHEGCTSQ